MRHPNLNANLNAEERKAALAQLSTVSDEVRGLIWAAMNGFCPYCFAQTERESHMMRAIKRGLTGDKLRAALEEAKATDAAQQIDPDTDHAVDCPLAVMIKAKLGT